MRRQRLPSAPELTQDQPSGVTDAPFSVGPYKIIAPIGSGGMAQVYLARWWDRHGIARNVALKLIPIPTTRDSIAEKVFYDETKVGVLIEHPNVCRVLDFGASNGFRYIAMEHLVGEPMSRILRVLATNEWLLQDPMHPYLSAGVVAAFCEGLHAAHEASDAFGEKLGVVHRDVSPHNVIVQYDGTVRLLDFGVARYESRRQVTEGRALKGKLSYMSPEYVKGQRVDRRADVWAMGIVLWEALTGRRLFAAETEVDRLRAVMERRIPAPSSLNDRVPTKLDRIVMSALTREQEDRCPSARELSERLEQFLLSSPSPVSAGTVSGWMRRMFPDGEREHLAKTRTGPGKPAPPPDTVRNSDDEGLTPAWPMPANRDEATLKSSVAQKKPTSVGTQPFLLSTRQSVSGSRALLSRRQNVLLGLFLVFCAFIAIVEARNVVGTTPAPPVELQFGEVHLSTRVPAVALWHDVALGPTPFRQRFPKGQHQVSVKYSDGTMETFDVDVRPGEVTHVAR